MPTYDLTPSSNRPGWFRLNAPELDPVLCPGGGIDVIAEGERSGTERATPVDLNPFQRASVEAFVARQGETRLLLEQAMAQSRAEVWGEAAYSASAEPWAEARVTYLYLPRRQTLTIEQFFRQAGWVGDMRGVAAEDMEVARREVAKADTATTRTRFVIAVKVEWDEEHHPYHAVVRDGELVAFGFEEL
jgi:hypothetical protein